MLAQVCDRPLVKKIRTGRGYYIYDGKSNRLLRVTSAMYDILDYFDKASELEIHHLMVNRHQPSDVAHALTILKELANVDQLFRSGPLDCRAGTICADHAAAHLRNGSEMITLEATDACNLRCKYCIFSGGCPHSRTHGRRKMPWPVAEAAIDFHRSLRLKFRLFWADAMPLGSKFEYKFLSSGQKVELL